jgi:hypothetical protein
VQYKWNIPMFLLVICKQLNIYQIHVFCLLKPCGQGLYNVPKIKKKNSVYTIYVLRTIMFLINGDYFRTHHQHPIGFYHGYRLPCPWGTNRSSVCDVAEYHSSKVNLFMYICAD